MGKQRRATASQASSSQLSSCSRCTVWQWWQVISKSFTPHCLLMLLFVCTCPSRDVFSGTIFKFREAEVFAITFFSKGGSHNMIRVLFLCNSALKNLNSLSFIVKNYPEILVNEMPTRSGGGHGCCSTKSLCDQILSFVENNVVLGNCLSFEFELKSRINPKRGAGWDSQGWKDGETPHRRKNTHFCFTVTVNGNSWISWTHTHVHTYTHTHTHTHSHTLTRLRFNYSIVRWRRNSSAFSTSN